MLPIIYLIVALIEISGEFLENFSIIYVAKPLLMPILMIWVYTTTKNKKDVVFLLLGLFFSWLGDLFLMIRHEFEPPKDKMFFIFGLAAFLIAHLNYIICFLKDVKGKNKIGFIEAKPSLIMPFIAFIVGLLYFLGDSIQAMKVPVYLYCIIITLMSIVALNRKGIVSATSFKLIFIGSLLFIFSDMCIAISVFKAPFYLSRVLIMSTYILAQYLIAKGYNTHIASATNLPTNQKLELK